MNMTTNSNDAPTTALGSAVLASATPGTATDSVAQAAAAAVASPQKDSIPMYEGDESWKNSLPEDLRSDPSVKITKTLADLAKGYVHAQKTIGADKFVVPGKNATEEDYLKIFDKLGRPDSPDKYDLQVRKGMKVNEEFFKGFKETLHKSGILPSQAGKLFEWYQGQVANAEVAQQQAEAKRNAESLDGLKKEWGNAFDSKLQDAAVGIKAIMGDQADAAINDPVLGNHPLFIRLAAKIGEYTKEDSDVSEGSEPSGRYTPSQASKMIGNILSDPKHPYNDGNHPNHKSAVEEMMKLFEAKSAQG